MSYDIERRVLQNFCKAKDFFGLEPFGLDGAPITLPTPPSDKSWPFATGFLTIIPGIGRQTSTGAPGANCHDYAGVAAITVLTRGEEGATGATKTIDQVISEFTNLKLDQDGNQPDATSTVVINFGRDGLAPYIASKRQEAPYLRTVINCPFIRSERK